MITLTQTLSKTAPAAPAASGLTYLEFTPNEALQPYVDCYWLLEGEPQPSNQPVREKVLPHAHPEMVFVYGNPFKASFGDDTLRRMPRSFIVGQLDKYINLETTGTTGALGVKFKPDGLYQLLQLPMTAFTNRSPILTDVLGAAAVELTAQVLSANSPYKRIDLVEQFLLKRVPSKPNALPYIPKAINKIMNSGGSVSVGELTDEFGVSERQMERKFLERVGLTPKLLARIARINHVFKLLKMYPQFSWLDVIYTCGYFDQAHFIRDFKNLAGETPTQFFARKSYLSPIFQGR
jgi:AraC-like DNA-binding protein